VRQSIRVTTCDNGQTERLCVREWWEKISVVSGFENASLQ